ncbi:MAG: GTP pyrophosphokinase, partial [Duncaniella sp.]|nr:GTP pyrophosphokinase [Duncaniella sp.]
YHVSTREELFYKLGSGEVSIDDYLNVNTSRGARSLVSRLFRLGFGGDNKKTKVKKLLSAPDPETAAKPVRQKINTKETYVLRFNEQESNFAFAECCRPIPGDEVMGFITDEGTVEVHSLTCPRAQVLKASFGSRIVATKWDEISGSFLANIRIEGIDRHGILQELTRMISTALNIDIRRLNIEADKEVFTCDLGVLVSNTDAVVELCKSVLKIEGVRKADRVRVYEQEQ